LLAHSPTPGIESQEMFQLWRLKWQRFRANLHYERELKKLLLQKKNTDEVSYNKFNELDVIDTYIDMELADSLIQEAKELDVDYPHLRGEMLDDPLWDQNQYSRRPYLSAKGRFELRRKIDDEKTHRFDVQTLWITKFWVPLLAALVGIIGALTGLVAVLHKK
jgi:hypothetical protein